MGYIDVKFRIDGVYVDEMKLHPKVETYPNHYDDGYSVLVDIDSKDMISVLEDNGYVITKEVS